MSLNMAQIVVKTIATTIMVLINGMMFVQGGNISSGAKKTFTVVNLLTLAAIWI